MQWSVLSIEICNFSHSLTLSADLDPGEGGLPPRPGEHGGDGVLDLLHDRTQNIRLASGLIIEIRVASEEAY